MGRRSEGSAQAGEPRPTPASTLREGTVVPHRRRRTSTSACHGPPADPLLGACTHPQRMFVCLFGCLFVCLRSASASASSDGRSAGANTRNTSPAQLRHRLGPHRQRDSAHIGAETHGRTFRISVQSHSSSAACRAADRQRESAPSAPPAAHRQRPTAWAAASGVPIQLWAGVSPVSPGADVGSGGRRAESQSSCGRG
jgi:hypothetical protein